MCRHGRAGSAGRGTHSPPSGGRSARQEAGQDFSMLSTVCCVLWPVIQFVACFQNELDPTAAGIWSEPSNRKTALGSCRTVADSWSIGLVSFLMSMPLLALIQPPLGVALTFSFAQVAEDRKFWNACTSGFLENARTNSPPPRTGLDVGSFDGK